MRVDFASAENYECVHVYAPTEDNEKGYMVAWIDRERPNVSAPWPLASLKTGPHQLVPANKKHRIDMATLMESLSLAETLCDAMDAGAIRNKFYKGEHP